ncbi:serine/threonine-protein kinase [Nocardia sp. NPDC048505]|uniref:serine/threonine-protein kinase n=1 Tax=unclassified Nocardia TaxID=2637762 RepID=UPI0033F9F1F9
MTGKLRPGTVFAGYLIEEVLGGGGMGTVYAARHPRLPRRDALKVLAAEHSADPEFRARFIREAELTARLNHPNVVAVHDRGVEDGRLWIAMQYIDGTDAEALLRPVARPSIERVLFIIEQAARGLDEAHRAGMVHRDVKPANILIDSGDGRPDRVLVTDFGIGRSASETTALTEAGTVLATLAYAAPEQLIGERVDHRADVYALGGTLYHLLTGAKPFPRATPAAIVNAHVNEPPPRPSAVRPELPPALDAVLAQAMAKSPQARFGSCGALAAAAIAAWRGGVVAPQPPPQPPVRRPRRARRGVIAGVLGVVAVLAGAGIVVANKDSGTTVATPPSATSVVRPITTTPAPASWGSHTFVVRAFPGLLPTAPDTTGFQGMRCVALDSDRRPVDLGVPAAGEVQLSCNGNKDPLHLLVVLCNVDRSSNTKPVIGVKDVVIGEQPWERISGTGRIVWRDVRGPNGAPAGAATVVFDDVGRRHCQLLIYGGDSGQNLVDRWWAAAPV